MLLILATFSDKDFTIPVTYDYKLTMQIFSHLLPPPSDQPPLTNK